MATSLGVPACCSAVVLCSFRGDETKQELQKIMLARMQNNIHCYQAQTYKTDKNTNKLLEELGFACKEIISCHSNKRVTVKILFWFLDLTPKELKERKEAYAKG